MMADAPKTDATAPAMAAAVKEPAIADRPQTPAPAKPAANVQPAPKPHPGSIGEPPGSQWTPPAQPLDAQPQLTKLVSGQSQVPGVQTQMQPTSTQVTPPASQAAVVQPPAPHNVGQLGGDAMAWAREFATSLRDRGHGHFDVNSIAAWFSQAMDAAHTARVRAEARGVGPTGRS